MTTPAELILLSCQIALALLLAAFAMTTIRIIAGPSLADRVLGLDLLVTLAIGFIAVIALITGQAVYLDIGLALALVGFLATIAFARFIASRAPPQGGSGHGLPHLPTGAAKRQAGSAPGRKARGKAGQAKKEARGKGEGHG